MMLICLVIVAQASPQGFEASPQSAPASVAVREFDVPVKPYALEEWPVPRLQWPFRSPLRIERRLVLRPSPRLVEVAPTVEEPRFRRSYQVIEPVARVPLAVPPPLPSPSKDLPPLPSPRKSPGAASTSSTSGTEERLIRLVEKLDQLVGDLNGDVEALGERLDQVETKLSEPRATPRPPAAAEPPPPAPSPTPRATPKTSGLGRVVQW